jgi:hypothetical protein
MKCVQLSHFRISIILIILVKNKQIMYLLKNLAGIQINTNENTRNTNGTFTG